METEEEKQTKEVDRSKAKRPKGWGYLILNLVAMAVVAFLLLGLAMVVLNLYTRHGKAIEMPEVRGMTQEQAKQRLAKDHLWMEITDSIYTPGEVPGIVLETTPKAGTLIKNRRTIYVTVNTMSVRSITIPKFEGLSARSVEQVLRGAGFSQVSVVLVPSPHDQLVLRMLDNKGRYLMSGDRVPYTTPLVLEVGSAEAYAAEMLDSLSGNVIDSVHPTQGVPLDEEEGGEQWF